MLVCALSLSGEVASGGTPLRVGPDAFAKAFLRCRRSIVQIRTHEAAKGFAIGFWIGAEGEFVFAGPATKGATLTLRTQDGKDHTAHVIGFDPATRLAVGRVDDSAARGEPIRVAERSDVALDEWVLSVTLDAKGAPTPFAGVVEDTPRGGTLRIARLAVPGQKGAPIVTLEGQLVAVALDDGPRKTRAVMLDSVTDFLRASVLGQ